MVDKLKQVILNKGYPFFEKGDYNINTIAIRSALHSNKMPVTNRYIDTLYVVYKVNDQWNLFNYQCTTVPGKYYFLNPMNKAFGTAILVPGFYQGCWALGLHYSKDALVQIGNVKLYRDKNLNEVIDLDPTVMQHGIYGINIHYSHDQSVTVDNWSAGCIVLQHGPASSKYQEFLNHYRNSVNVGYSNKFSLALIDENDMK